MYNYLTNFRSVLLGAPLQLGALSARLVRLWVNPALLASLFVIYSLINPFYFPFLQRSGNDCVKSVASYRGLLYRSSTSWETIAELLDVTQC